MKTESWKSPRPSRRLWHLVPANFRVILLPESVPMWGSVEGKRPDALCHVMRVSRVCACLPEVRSPSSCLPTFLFSFPPTRSVARLDSRRRRRARGRVLTRCRRRVPCPPSSVHRRVRETSERCGKKQDGIFVVVSQRPSSSHNDRRRLTTTVVVSQRPSSSHNDRRRLTTTVVVSQRPSSSHNARRRLTTTVVVSRRGSASPPSNSR
jgi:hypothetical protein